MNSNEKAKELVEKFRLNVLDYEGCSINEHKAKQCALIAVDEMLKNGVLYNNTEELTIDCEPNQTFGYWQSVKSEIENL